MQLEEDRIKKIWIVKQEKEEYQTTKNYFEALKKAYAENYKSELERLKKEYQEAYRAEGIKEDKLNQRQWQEQLALYCFVMVVGSFQLKMLSVRQGTQHFTDENKVSRKWSDSVYLMTP